MMLADERKKLFSYTILLLPSFLNTKPELRRLSIIRTNRQKARGRKKEKKFLEFANGF